MGEDFTLLDVRSEIAYRAGHIIGAVSIPLTELQFRLREIDCRKEIIVYCQSGVISQTAARVLVEAGFNDVRNMAGGLLVWKWGLAVGDSGSRLIVQ